MSIFTKPRIVLTISIGCAMLAAAVTLAQFRGRRFRGYEEGPIDRGNIPTWRVDDEFRGDLFTFVRIRYRSTYERQSLAWYTDYPDADLNLSFRLQQYTTLAVNPEPKVIDITDPELLDYPWAFMSGVGNIVLDDHEAESLRRYLENGGFLMVDDFWGERQWSNFYTAIKLVFPKRELVDLPRSHEIFHCLFDLPDDRPLQTTNIGNAVRNRESGITWEGADGREPHFRAILDDNGRIMVMICHNTDTGDGWEEEGTDAWFFHEFSVNKCYPLGFNIVFYAMTR
jgi:hypothetical protein